MEDKDEERDPASLEAPSKEREIDATFTQSAHTHAMAIYITFPPKDWKCSKPVDLLPIFSPLYPNLQEEVEENTANGSTEWLFARL